MYLQNQPIAIHNLQRCFEQCTLRCFRQLVSSRAIFVTHTRTELRIQPGHCSRYSSVLRRQDWAGVATCPILLMGLCAWYTELGSALGRRSESAMTSETSSHFANHKQCWFASRAFHRFITTCTVVNQWNQSRREVLTLLVSSFQKSFTDADLDICTSQIARR